MIPLCGRALAPPLLLRSARGRTISKMEIVKRYGILAVAAAAGDLHGGGRIDPVGGGGALSSGAAQDLRLVGVHSSHQDGVLVGLGGRQLQALVLALQRTDVVLVQRVEDGPGVGVLVVDDVPGGGLDGIAGVADLGGHVVAHAVNGPLGAAAAIRKLGGQVAEAALHAVEALHHAHVGVVEPVGQGVGDGIGAVTNALGDAVQLGHNG